MNDYLEEAYQYFFIILFGLTGLAALLLARSPGGSYIENYRPPAPPPIPPQQKAKNMRVRQHRKWKVKEVSSAFGAPMGRVSLIPPDHATYPYNFHMQQLCWVDGAYDEGGAYWGRGKEDEHIFWAEHPEDANGKEACLYVRARSLTQAQARVRETFPLATFNYE